DLPGTSVTIPVRSRGVPRRYRRPRRHPILPHAAPGGEAARAAHDPPHLAGHALPDPPRLPRTVMADLLGAERAVSAALAVLFSRKASYVEVSLAETAEALAAPLRAGLTAPDGMLGGGLPVYGLYEASDGWIAGAALQPGFR